MWLHCNRKAVEKMRKRSIRIEVNHFKTGSNNLDVYHFCLLSNLRAMGGLDRSTHPLIKEKRSTIYVDKYSASFRCNGLEPFAKM